MANSTLCYTNKLSSQLFRSFTNLGPFSPTEKREKRKPTTFLCGNKEKTYDQTLEQKPSLGSNLLKFGTELVNQLQAEGQKKVQSDVVNLEVSEGVKVQVGENRVGLLGKVLGAPRTGRRLIPDVGVENKWSGYRDIGSGKKYGVVEQVRECIVGAKWIYPAEDVVKAALIFLWMDQARNRERRKGRVGVSGSGSLRKFGGSITLAPRQSIRNLSTTGRNKSAPVSDDLQQRFVSDESTDDDIPKKGTGVDPKARLYTIGCGWGKDDGANVQIKPSSGCITCEHAARNFGEDAGFIISTSDADVIGVSDGVGGWRNHGVDPSIFSYNLMKNAKESIENGKFKVDQPVQLLSSSYNKLYSIPDLIGSATACIATFDRNSKMLYTANLGDSGFFVIREQKVIHKSKAQQHYFNAPLQLSIIPDSSIGKSFHDSPQKADFSSFQCEHGDIIVLASDGYFDNVHEEHYVQLLEHLGIEPGLLGDDSDSGLEDSDSDHVKFEAVDLGHKIYTHLQNAVSNIVAYTRARAHDQKYLSPFSIEAAKAGYNGVLGGKVDDITVLVSVVGAR